MKIKEAIEWMKKHPMQEMVCVTEGNSFKGDLLRFNPEIDHIEYQDPEQVIQFWRTSVRISKDTRLDWEPKPPKYEDCEPSEAEIVRIPAQEHVIQISGIGIININGRWFNTKYLTALGATFHRKKPVEVSVVDRVMKRFFDKPDYTRQDIERILEEELGGGK